MAVLSDTTIVAFQLLGKDKRIRTLWTCIGCDLLGYRMKARVIAGDSSAIPKISFNNFGASVSKSEIGNKPQVAQAGGNITQINYYGTDYAAAKTDALMQMDPEKFTKPITALMGGPALKSPTVEECGYSDRILQLTAGNSTITTQEAVDAVVAYAHWPTPSQGSGEAIDKLSTPGPAVDRFYTLDSIDWTTSFPGYFWRLPGALSDLGVFGQNCAFHYLMRSGFCVHLQLNASKFHQGCVMLVAIPEAQYSTSTQEGSTDMAEIQTDFYLQYPLHQMTLFPHQFINLRTNNSATLILPYMNSVPAENAITHNYWMVCVLPIVPLQYSAGASTIVPMTLSIAPMHAEFSGLRQAVAVRQGVPTFQIPGSGQFVTTIRNSGYPLYPEFEPTHSHFIPGEVTNLCEVMQVDTFCKLGTNSFMLLEVGVRNNDPILTFDMDLTSDVFSTTYLARCCKWFTNYRGSVRLTFTFCGSAMATGKLLLAYTPPGGDAPPNRTQAMLGTHMVWDLGLQSSVTFIVPWISQTQYRFPNTTANVYSYAGFVTVWYQTSIVVPPGAPSTCGITMMCGACEDFQVRLPTDNAYFQGIGDTLGKVIEHELTTALQPTQVPASKPAVQAGELTVQTGDAPALTASESGASTTTDPSTVMETRSVPVSFSARESCLENFFSRYAPVQGGTMDWGQINDMKTGFLINVPISFNDIHTQLAIRAKYNMFTYFRCAYDLVLVVENETFEFITGDPSGNATNAVSYPVKFEAAFVPPGGPALTTFNAPAWDMPTIPKVLFQSNGVPASMRIPFMSVANAYRCFFDGYSTFRDGTYGRDPGNFIGTIYVRNFINILTAGIQSVRYRTHWKLYARPVHVQAWGPRPIRSLKTTNRISDESRNRIYLVDDDTPTLRTLHIGTGPWGTDEIVNYGKDEPMDTSEEVPMEVDQTPEQLAEEYYQKDLMGIEAMNTKMRKWLNRCPVFCIREFHYHGIPVAHNLVAINYHLALNSADITVVKGPKWFRVEHLDPEHDLAILRFKPNSFVPVPLCDNDHPCRAWVGNDCEFDGAIFLGEAQGIAVAHFNASPLVPAHDQFHLMAFTAQTKEGWCGSPVMCDRGVCGMITGGSLGVTLATAFKHIDELHPMDVDRKEDFSVPYTIGQQIGHRSKRQKKGRPYTQFSAETQGPWDWFKSMGDAFGSGMLESAREEVNRLLPQFSTQELSNSTTQQVLSWLVKAICSAVLIAKAEDKASAAGCVGCILGVDFLTSSPFDWLKSQVLGMLGIKSAQGPTEWLKEFNAFCQAARGLDWIGHQVSKFIEWFKKLIHGEIPARKEFYRRLETFPDIMESLDNVIANRGKYEESKVLALIKNMENLKKGADLFGVERSYASMQIGKYYEKAMDLKKSIASNRHEPIAVVFRGTPGCGKSLATNLVGGALAKRCGGSKPYSLPPDPKHFDGYCGQSVVIMDDVGQNPDGADLALFCQMVSSTEFMPPMADLKDKGRAFVSDFVLCSTNCQDLRPPTIASPEALDRRFYLDLDVSVKQAYSKAGRLDAQRALNPDVRLGGGYFKGCPFTAGQACTFKDRKTKREYTLEEIVDVLLAEREKRRCCLNLLEAQFQGPTVVGHICRDDCNHHPMIQAEDPAILYVEDDFNFENVRLETIEETIQKEKKQSKPTPQEIIDLIKAVPNKDVIDFCIKQGWVMPQKSRVEIVRQEIMSWTAVATSMFAGLILVLTSAILIYEVYQLFKSKDEQGPYTGQPKKAVKQPQLRKAVVQGPGMEFESRLLRSSLFDVETAEGHFTGLGVYDEWMLLPRHAKPGECVKVEETEFQVVDCLELVQTAGDLELVAIKLNRPVKFRDIRKYFPQTFTSEKDAKLLINNTNFRNMFCPVGVVTRYGSLNLSGMHVVNTCMYRYPTKSGQCGGVVVANNRIVAMHIGGDGLNGYGAILKQSYMNFDRKDATEQGQIVATRPAERSVNVSSKTSLHPSVFFDVFEGTKEPAALRKTDKRLEVDLDTAMFAKYKGNKEIGDCEELDMAVDHYVAQLQTILPENVTEPLSLEEVVYGIENLEGLDLNTSAGFPYVTEGVRKRDLIPEKGEPLTKLQAALDLHGTNLPFVTYLKDELRPIEKVKLGKTRLIECSSLNDTIWMKTKLGRLFQTFHANPGTVTGSAVGCNPDVHWSKFRAEIGDNPLLAFDYSNFDASLGPFWFEALKKVLKKIGYDSDKLINYICYSKHIYKDLEYDVEGGMPSGCSGTSIFNSIINNLIIRTLVLRCYKGIDLDSLKIIAYGDDVICSYPWQLDAQQLAEEGAKFGLTMTPADKSASFNEVTWDNVTFLKRRFVPDEEFPFLIHPVFPMSEIHESIRWCRSAAHTQEHVSSLCYLAWHAGKREYEQFVEKIRSVKIGKALFLPAYSVLRRAWLDSF
ncbi:polyprotein [parabovirus A4]|uniref:Genome polyprotein n=1 Tax=Picornavirales sp. TaxID=1955153 RepID=A0A2H4RDT9_9VIRU|nr:polyprotein [parabovirus A4]